MASRDSSMRRRASACSLAAATASSATIGRSPATARPSSIAKTPASSRSAASAVARRPLSPARSPAAPHVGIVAERQQQGLQVLRLGHGAREEPPEREVLRPVVQGRDGRLAVAARAADLLVVLVDALGGRGVHDEAHVGLVDAHPERARGHHDGDLAVVEGRRQLAAPLRGQAAVVAVRGDAALAATPRRTPRSHAASPRRAAQARASRRRRRARRRPARAPSVCRTTRRAMFGRSKPWMRIRGSRIRRRSTTSSRTGRDPVAVRARIGGRAPSAPRAAAARRPRRGAGSRAGSRGPTTRRSGPRRRRGARSARPRAVRRPRRSRAARARGRGSRARRTRARPGLLDPRARLRPS